MSSHDSHNTPGTPGAEGTGGRDLDAIVASALALYPDNAARLRAGDKKAIGSILGHVMRETAGLADGSEVVRIASEQLGI